MRGAKRRSNPESLRGKTLDCFAALAMTGRERGLKSPNTYAAGPAPPAARRRCRSIPSCRAR
ncbi:hypothetical protein C7U92_24390 [Bradyrhizobium sp. WBOS7]|uniref:Uncharacterized protein n=1 Tax=Bradyrhizobium betae TaxID=244734 RepID=A0AAE9SRL3_9BRAD|nr:hypothetical protein [Bradyrhizobium sp. WBOS2]MDD1573840.1 hypothetical protein [Bradyrhizobium sp. WBOS1]MDD1579841.1 hypothetical protein [Bradyrhizobium sp. WBOS7]MDD1602883.1 hypothetical protein [Bradyrhizobium sp. WBOS16]UUO34369.1 hypothetical protein DCK84_07125 [Bradyrhizobium sp. WBOS01]UUO40799.1 hypothetical protein DCM75_08545 [Bradyrhizobium sp. WBOS02]UUO52897.1 hypothetical protein DCM79_07815 [Bradyrhizobium sp. WBOS07]UUO65068.1 hypothetical protein DCM83_07440 [Bradyrh